jgi:preprotein translocase subunit SecA
MALTPESVAGFDREALSAHLHARLMAHYTAKMQAIGEDQRCALERWVMLQVIDKYWKDHLLAMDYLKEGIGLRGYGQKNPLNEYKREAYEMFVGMTERIKAEALELLFKVELTRVDDELTVRPRRREQHIMQHRGALAEAQADTEDTAVKTVRRQGAKVGRNAPCPCGSGKKYKKCCGA